MSHLGYVAYLSIVVALFASPVIGLVLFLAWKRGRFARALATVLLAVPAVAVVVYVLMRYGA